MGSSWYCNVFGQELGPMTSQQLIEMARNHNLLPTDMVKRNNSKWVAAKTVKGLFEPGSSGSSSSISNSAADAPGSPAVATAEFTPRPFSDHVLEETQYLPDTMHEDESPTAIVRGLSPGAMLGNYIVLEKLGEGGMGIVLKAQHRRMERMVALKVLHSEATRSPAAVKRFQQEVKAAAKLVHPNIVTAYDADEAAGAHFLVMEFVDGTDLADIVNKRGPLPIRDAVNYILQAARGLAYAHDEGVVHRDIKPGNLLVDKRGSVKILDMGLARIDDATHAIAEATAAESLTQAGQVLGTLDYMSPEQAEDARNVDHRADIYSLGCTFYRLLTGKPPYAGETAVNKILAHSTHPIPLVSASRKGVPVELDAVFRQMVAKRPDDRYQSLNDLVTDLEMFLSSGNVRGETMRLAKMGPGASEKKTSSKPAGQAPLPSNEGFSIGPATVENTGDSLNLEVAPLAAQYYRQVMGEVLGPFSYEQLRMLRKKKKVARDDMVRREGETAWFRADEIDGLF